MTFTEYLCKAHNLDERKELANYKKYAPKIDLKSAMFKAVFENFITLEIELIGKTRKREIVMQRHIMMYFLRSTNQYSFREIGIMFGNRDHSSIIHACDKVEQFLSYEDKLFMPYFKVIKEAFDNGNKID
jgi:chromosomal replication initiator protein